MQGHGYSKFTRLFFGDMIIIDGDQVSPPDLQKNFDTSDNICIYIYICIFFSQIFPGTIFCVLYVQPLHGNASEQVSPFCLWLDQSSFSIGCLDAAVRSIFFSAADYTPWN